MYKFNALGKIMHVSANIYLMVHYPTTLLIREILKTAVKNIPSSDSDSINNGIVINSPSLFSVFECLLPTWSNYLPILCNKFGFTRGSSCLSAVTVLRDYGA